ncbi:MAG: cellulose binding domain-containing protein, partial [Oscillospiraceae bacterium]|nr:cellulose binding domain-containing protein [Oscillospiraceae bacterium]
VLERSYTGTLVFDYDEYYYPILDYIDGYDWGVKIFGNHNNVSFKITDNKSNTIVDFGQLTKNYNYTTTIGKYDSDTTTDGNSGVDFDVYSYTAEKPISLSIGDLNYDGVVDLLDYQIYYNAKYHDKELSTLSNLQKELAKSMEDLLPIHIAITPHGYDDIAEALDSINAGNIYYGLVPYDISYEELIAGNYDALFINCASNISIDTEVVRKFAEQGGVVYASDWAISILKNAFPERNFSYQSMKEQTVIGNIIDNGLHISTNLDTVDVDFDMSAWRLIDSTLQDDVKVYVSGIVDGAEDNIEYPLSFSFPYGENGGKIFYTSFHQDANITDDMQKVLNDMIITLNYNKTINEYDSYSEENRHKLTATVVGTVDAGATSDIYTLDTLQEDDSFIILTDGTDNYSIELTAPDGSIYTNFENGEFIEDSNSTVFLNSSNNMRVYRLGRRGIQVINPISSTDDNHWSFTVTSHVNYRSSFAVGLAEKVSSSSESSENSDYIIEYKIANDWVTGQNIEITITNTGTNPIRNWALRCDDFCGTITSLWNCKLQGDTILRCQDYNTDIPVGESITMGYNLINPTGRTPEFKLCSFRSAKQNGYSVDFNVTAEWGENFIGEITITNTTDEPIMAWELNFDTVNFTISATDQFEILTNINQNYTITGTYNGNIPIEPHSSIIMQFNGEKTGTPFLSNISMTEMKIEE